VDNTNLYQGRIGKISQPVAFYEMNYSYPLDNVNDLYYRVEFKRTNHTYKITRPGPCEFYDGEAIKL
jgi:hypothetical protein